MSDSVKLRTGSSQPETISISTTMTFAQLLEMIGDDEFGAFNSKNDAVAQGLAFLDWAVTEVKNDRQVVCLFEATMGYNEASLPFMQKVRGEPPVPFRGIPSPPFTVTFLSSEAEVELFDKLADPAYGAFESRADVFNQVVILLGWAASMVEKGAVIASMDRGTNHYARLEMDFITRLQAAF